MGVVMTGLPWFRMYHRIIDDKKLKLLAFEDRWHFVALCCLKCSGELDEPDFGLRVKQVAVALGLSSSELDLVLKRLKQVKLVDEEMHPVNWEKLQFKSDQDKTAAERQRRKRKKDKELKGVTDMSRVTVTDVTRLDTEVESTDTDISPKGDCASGDTLKPRHVFDKWNEVAARIGKRGVRDLTPTRRQALAARIAQYPIADFVLVFEKVEASEFLRDGNFCQFDWIIKRANFQKILEGNYDD